MYPFVDDFWCQSECPVTFHGPNFSAIPCLSDFLAVCIVSPLYVPVLSCMSNSIGGFPDISPTASAQIIL